MNLHELAKERERTCKYAMNDRRCKLGNLIIQGECIPCTEYEKSEDARPRPEKLETVGDYWYHEVRTEFNVVIGYNPKNVAKPVRYTCYNSPAPHVMNMVVDRASHNSFKDWQSGHTEDILTLYVYDREYRKELQEKHKKQREKNLQEYTHDELIHELTTRPEYDTMIQQCREVYNWGAEDDIIHVLQEYLQWEEKQPRIELEPIENDMCDYAIYRLNGTYVCKKYKNKPICDKHPHTKCLGYKPYKETNWT